MNYNNSLTPCNKINNKKQSGFLVGPPQCNSVWHLSHLMASLGHMGGNLESSGNKPGHLQGGLKQCTHETDWLTEAQAPVLSEKPGK